MRGAARGTYSVLLGVLKNPSPSAQPGSLVHAGEAVTLCCHSELVSAQLILGKEGDARHSWQVVEKLRAGNRQAHFSMGTMTPARAGTCRCYGSVRHSPKSAQPPVTP